MPSPHPSYLAVFLTAARNSLVRDMTFRGNFIIECVTSVAWMSINLCFYLLVYTYTTEIGGWDRWAFFVFLATVMLVNGLIQTFIMTNAQEFSDSIRLGTLDFVLVKPIDTQFAVSFNRIQWSSLTTIVYGALVLVYSLLQLNYTPGLMEIVLYPLYIVCGVAIMYSLMISLTAATVWMVRNQSLGEVWFYITIFSRYPLEIYRGPLGMPLQLVFTFALPILIVANVPARLLAKPLERDEWYLAIYALGATVAVLLISRWIFNRALAGYRSASS